MLGARDSSGMLAQDLEKRYIFSFTSQRQRRHVQGVWKKQGILEKNNHSFFRSDRTSEKEGKREFGEQYWEGKGGTAVGARGDGSNTLEWSGRNTHKEVDRTNTHTDSRV